MCSPCLSSQCASHGVAISATSSENIIASDAPMGIGLIYGPIKPETKTIGNTDAITVNVARMVGLPTSLMAASAACILAIAALRNAGAGFLR